MRRGGEQGGGGLLVGEMEEGGDHEWKGWVVVSLSTRADGYLSRLINDAYVNRLWSLPRTSPLIREVRFASSEIDDYPSWWRSFSDRLVYLRTGPCRVLILRDLSKEFKSIGFFLSFDDLDNERFLSKSLCDARLIVKLGKRTLFNRINN